MLGVPRRDRADAQRPRGEKDLASVQVPGKAAKGSLYQNLTALLHNVTLVPEVTFNSNTTAIAFTTLPHINEIDSTPYTRLAVCVRRSAAPAVEMGKRGERARNVFAKGTPEADVGPTTNDDAIRVGTSREHLQDGL